MGQRYLIDSNVIIDYTTNILPAKISEFLEQIFNTDFLISAIVKIYSNLRKTGNKQNPYTFATNPCEPSVAALAPRPLLESSMPPRLDTTTCAYAIAGMP